MPIATGHEKEELEAELEVVPNLQSLYASLTYRMVQMCFTATHHDCQCHPITYFETIFLLDNTLLVIVIVFFCWGQGRRLLDIDFPEGPFGTKVSCISIIL